MYMRRTIPMSDMLAQRDRRRRPIFKNDEMCTLEKRNALIEEKNSQTGDYLKVINQPDRCYMELLNSEQRNG
jgi:hypothetical protein